MTPLGHRLPRRSARRTPAAPSTFRAAAALSRTRKVPAQETGSCCDILLITVGLFGRKLAVMGSSLAKQLPARVRLTSSAARCPTPALRRRCGRCAVGPPGPTGRTGIGANDTAWPPSSPPACETLSAAEWRVRMGVAGGAAGGLDLDV